MYDEDVDGTVGGPWMIMDYVSSHEFVTLWSGLIMHFLIGSRTQSIQRMVLNDDGPKEKGIFLCGRYLGPTPFPAVYFDRQLAFPGSTFKEDSAWAHCCLIIKQGRGCKRPSPFQLWPVLQNCRLAAGHST